MKYVAIIMLFLVFFSGMAYGQKIGGIFAGTDSFINGNQFKNGPSTFRIENTGIAFGFFLPVNFPHFDSFYKVQVSLRNGTDVTTNQDRDYISATNEFLIGKRIPIQASRWDILPQMGLGLMLENIYEDWGVGVVYDLMFIDAAVTFNRHFDKISLGIMVNYEHGFYSSYNDYDVEQRLGVSLILWK